MSYYANDLQFGSITGASEGQSEIPTNDNVAGPAYHENPMEGVADAPFEMFSPYDTLNMAHHATANSTAPYPQAHNPGLWQQVELDLPDAHMMGDSPFMSMIGPDYNAFANAALVPSSPMVDPNAGQQWANTSVHVHNRARRPQLSLLTPGLATQVDPTPVGTFGPHSAPAIRIDGPDSLPAQVNITANMSLGSTTGRRRSQSTPRTMLEQHGRCATAPEADTRPDDFLSPDMAQWVMRDSYLPGDRTLQSMSWTEDSTFTSSQTAPSSPASDGIGDGESLFHCEYAGCRKSFKSRTALKHHGRYHTPERLRRFPCDICGTRFLFQREVNRHRNSHLATSQRPFKCPACEYRASRSDHLKRHMKKHARVDSAISPVSSCGSESLMTPSGSRPFGTPRMSTEISQEDSSSAVRAASKDINPIADFTPDFQSSMLSDEPWDPWINSAPESPMLSASWGFTSKSA